MRESYWNDESSPSVQIEKQYFQSTLTQHGVFKTANLEDARYFFFSLPSIIIVKGYALGFLDQSVQSMISTFIQANKLQLMHREELKIQYRM